jgi:hypothetical protein
VAAAAVVLALQEPVVLMVPSEMAAPDSRLNHFAIGAVTAPVLQVRWVRQVASPFSRA